MFRSACAGVLFDATEVLAHPGSRFVREAGLDRGVNRDVVLDRAGGDARSALEDGPQRAVQHVPDRVHQVGGEPVLGRFGNADVEAEVGIDVRLLVLQASAHRVDCAGHLGELCRRSALGCQGGELALEQPADLVELADVRLLEVEEEVERAVELVARLGDGEQAGVAVSESGPATRACGTPRGSTSGRRAASR